MVPHLFDTSPSGWTVGERVVTVKEGTKRSTLLNMRIILPSSLLLSRKGHAMEKPSPHKAPADAAQRRSAPPVLTYTVDMLPPFDAALYEAARQGMTKVAELTIPPRDADTFDVPAGHFFRIVSVDGPQVGDLNLWNAADLSERFFSGKTRALHASHVSTGDRLWSNLPHLRPLATITHDTLDWYGWDEDGAGVHDILGTRCDPYTNFLLKGVDYRIFCSRASTTTIAAIPT
jgi:uncharacterized protein YcgI (DUF1989 family)